MGIYKEKEEENTHLEPEEGLTLPNLHVHNLLIIFPGAHNPAAGLSISCGAEGSLGQQARPQPSCCLETASGSELDPGSSIWLGGMPSSPRARGTRLRHCWNALSRSLPEKKHFKTEIPVQHTGVKVLELYVLKQISAPSQKSLVIMEFCIWYPSVEF